MKRLRDFRNGAFHFQPEYFTPKFADFMRDPSSVAWVREITSRFGEYLRNTTPKEIRECRSGNDAWTALSKRGVETGILFDSNYCLLSLNVRHNRENQNFSPSRRGPTDPNQQSPSPKILPRHDYSENVIAFSDPKLPPPPEIVNHQEMFYFLADLSLGKSPQVHKTRRSLLGKIPKRRSLLSSAHCRSVEIGWSKISNPLLFFTKIVARVTRTFLATLRPSL